MKSKKAEQPPVIVIVLETPAPEMTPKAKKARAKRLATAELPKSRPMPPMKGARQTRFASEVKAPAMPLNVPSDAPLPPTPKARVRDSRLMKAKL